MSSLLFCYTFEPFISYNGVGNITNITNSAAKINGIGGPYHVDYTYDGLYRMTHAEGWHGSESNFYDMQMGYYPNGRIQHKKLTCPDICCRNCICIYDNGYNYVSGNRLNRIEPLPIPTVQPGGGTVAPEPGTGSGDPTTVQINYDYSFQWDGAGNMMRQTDNIHNSVRQLSWDAENRLQGVKDNAYLSLYQYDANGERTYKLTGSGYTQIINGVPTRLYALTSATLYASPYMVATVKGYTKHYYAESERIASRIGNGGLACIDTPLVDLSTYTSKLSANSAYFDTVVQNRLSAPNYITAHLLDTLYYWKTPHGNTEPDCYWYHPDHLGSASWVTSSNGDVVQYLYYLPWGEDYLNQRRNGYSGARHTFSAKERDTETGLSYFGSRYYSSDLSIWLSVDPQAAKYPSLSPYVYCANNPIKLVDPNGEEVEYNSFEDRLITFFARVLSSDFRQKFKVLKQSEETYVFNKNNGGINNFTTDGEKLFINYSINEQSRSEGQTIFSNLRHETTHGIQFEYGEIGFELRGLGWGILDRNDKYFETQVWHPINYDLTDEYEAHTTQNLGFRMKNDSNSSQSQWNKASESERYDALSRTSAYRSLNKVSQNNTNTERIKNGKTYARPYSHR